MTTRSRGTLQTGARFIWSNVLSNGASWIESFELAVNGAELAGADTSDWRIVVKECDGGSPVLTLSSDGDLTVTQNTTETLFEIDADAPTSLCGDYEVDLVERTAAGKIVHWCNGIFTFRKDNLWVD